MDKQEKRPSGWASLVRLFFSPFQQIVSFTVRLFRRFRDRKTHIYHTCPVCKKFLRIAREDAAHGVNCPDCHGHFSIKQDF